MNKYKKAFTLVELIVVITILAILGTIAFISLQGYSQDARDSVRISDISKIKTSLELFQLDAGKYPETTDYFTVTYSGAVAWTQGTFGTTTHSSVSKIDKIPLDPVTDRQYIYSITNTRQEYQLAGIMEGDDVTLLFNQANSAQKTARLKISGNYNGKILKVSTGGIDYLLAVPSIITSSGFTLEQIVANKYLAYNGYKNLAAQYTGSSYDVLGDSGIKLVNSAYLVVYSGLLETLSDTNQTGIGARKNLIKNLQKAYTGTNITSVGEIAQIMSTQTTDAAATELLSSTMLNNYLGSHLEIGKTDFTGSVNLFTIGTSAPGLNIADLLGNPTETIDATIEISSGVIISATSTSAPAIISGSLPIGSNITIINKGAIIGKGGKGGDTIAYGAFFPGLPGGNAIEIGVGLNINLSIDNTQGYIFGGGGGGGASYHNNNWGAGGGGGAGGGAKGSGGSCTIPSQPGTDGILGAGGVGASGTCSRPSGRGGNYGEAGAPGGIIGTDGAGGAAGKAIVLNGSSITWLGGNDSTRVKGTVN